MSGNVPAYDELGVPESLPVAVLKFAQAGRLAIVKVSWSPSASAATGWNE
jgi:hypothetical protein